MAGDVVGVPGLRLKRQEDPNSLLGRGEAEDERAILPYPVVTCELWMVALVHVDVVDAVAWYEPEDLVTLVLLRPPGFAEGVHSSEPCSPLARPT